MSIFTLLKEFLESEKAGGFILIICTILSLIVTNSPISDTYLAIWNAKFGGESIVHWINDGLMTLFFLLIGLELKREFLEGQFRQIKNALLPIFAALGGMLIPAACHAIFNYGTATQAGAGIPMATDAAFALAILSLVGKKAPLALKMLLLAVAVVDDLCAIFVIAIFYTGGLIWFNIAVTVITFIVLLLLNRFGIRNLLFYIIGGLIMWYFMLHSGVHATISGVLLAVAIPYKQQNETSPSNILQHQLHKPVAFIILPLFALANTAIVLGGNIFDSLATSNSIGILSGLVIGKPLGVVLFSIIAIKLKIGTLHLDLNWKHLLGVGILAGIGFTISIFVSLLAFTDIVIINQSKIAVLTASIIAAVLAYVWLSYFAKKPAIRSTIQSFQK
jgi:Na+:H+ antiporter, NhaA family